MLFSCLVKHCVTHPLLCSTFKASCSAFHQQSWLQLTDHVTSLSILMFALTSITWVLNSALKPTSLSLSSKLEKMSLCPDEASLLPGPIITWYQKQHLSHSTSVRALRCDPPPPSPLGEEEGVRQVTRIDESFPVSLHPLNPKLLKRP